MDFVLLYKKFLNHIFTQQSGYLKNLILEFGNETVNYAIRHGLIEANDDFWEITIIGKEEYYSVFPRIDGRPIWKKWLMKITAAFLKTFI